MKWVLGYMLLLCRAGSFVVPSPFLRSVILSPWWEERTPPNDRRARHTPKTSCRCSCTVPGEPSNTSHATVTDGVPNENSPPDVTGVSDIDLDELLKGLNIGSPRKERKATTVETNEPDEMKLIMALRKQMGEEDFNAIFDPRNPRIGNF